MSAKRRDTLITHCLGRAMRVAYGWDEAEDQFNAGTLKVSNWSAARAAPKATRVAGFIVAWAIAMRSEGKDEYTITEYERFWNAGERQAYRSQKEFRELWREYETPNELAAQIVKQLDGKLAEKNRRKLPLSLVVLA